MSGLLERDAELRRIARALERARDGHGGALIVGGPAGIGKSALLAEARAAAEAGGAVVLRARGAELEREFGFGVVRQLYEPRLAAAPPDARAEWLEGAAGLAVRLLGLPGAGATPDPAAVAPDPSFAILHGLYWLCAQLATEAPLCLVVDDAHWADTASLRYLAFLLGRLDELRVTLLLGLRLAEPGAAADLVRALAADPAAELIEPPPLSERAVARLVADGLQAEPAPAFAAACHRATGGVPFLVDQLIRALGDDGVPPTAEAAPRLEDIGSRSVGRWVLLRLGRLPRPAGQLARAVAVLEVADPAQAAELAGLDRDEAGRAADALAAAGILQSGWPLQFVHPVVRRAIYDEIGSGERADGHRRAARLLVAAGAPAERVAEHLLAGEPAAEPWVVEHLWAAARTATGNGAADSAVAYLDRALVEPPAEEQRSALLLELGLAELTAGRDGAFAHLGAAVEAAPDTEPQVTAALVHGLALARENRFAEGIEVLDRVAAAVPEGGELLGGALEILAVGIAMLDVEMTEAHRGRLEAARRRATDLDAAPRELRALAGLIAVQSNEPAEVAAGLARRAVDGVIAEMPEATDLPFLQQAAVTLLWTEHHEELGPLLDAAIEQGRAIGDPSLFAGPLAYRGLMALHRGDLRAAEADARTALEATGLPAPALYRVLNVAVAVESLVEQGELEAAEALLGPVDSEVEIKASVTATTRLSRARLRLIQRRFDESLADATGAGDVARRLGFDGPGWLPWRACAVPALLALGRQEEATRLAAEDVELARAFGAPRTLGIALHGQGLAAGEAGEASLRQAIELHERAGAALDRARSLCALGALLRRTKRRAEGRELLREALDVAHRAGARPMADVAETEVRATGARPRRVVLTGLEALTASERRVAELAAEGLTNRQIAQSLFVTARTVEGHLTGVFRKLDVSSRADLGAALTATATGAARTAAPGDAAPA
jgi:DNA-binding CsgD family transcriptional regulator